MRSKARRRAANRAAELPENTKGAFRRPSLSSLDAKTVARQSLSKPSAKTCSGRTTSFTVHVKACVAEASAASVAVTVTL